MRPLLSALVLVAPSLLGAQASQSPVMIVPAPAATLPLKHAPQPTTPAITAADLMTRLYIFADDSMMGREAGTLGNYRGTTYIAAEVKRMGLLPAGENGSYFQTIPYRSRSLAPTSTISVPGASLRAGTDWALYGKPLPSAPFPVAFGGVLGDNSPRIAADKAVGKIVVYRVLPAGAALIGAPGTFPPRAAAVALLDLDPYIESFSHPTTVLDDPSAREEGSLPPLLVMSAPAAAKLFNAPLTDLTAGTVGKTAITSFDVKLEPVAYPARNVVALLRGSDPTLAGEYVAIGAHNDHLGFLPPVDHDSMRIYNHIVRPGGAEQSSAEATPEQQAEVNAALTALRATHPGAARVDSIANGADDDGSGSVTVLEIAEHLASLPTKPKRSVLFVWHVGEEKGLLGSQYFTDHPTVPRDSIVAQLNIDMVGRGDAWDVTGETKSGQVTRGGSNYVQLVGSRRLSTELGDLIEQTNRDGNHGLDFDYAMDANGHQMNIYCRSDHYEYARYGIPITFFTTGGHSDYHQVTDEPQYIDYPHMARIGQLVDDVAVRLANLDHRVVVDKAKPDPNGSCQQ